MRQILITIMVLFFGAVGVFGDPAATQPSDTIRAFRTLRIEAPSTYSDLVMQFEKDNLTDNGSLNYFDLSAEYAPATPPTVRVEKSADKDAPLLLISVEAHVTGNAPAPANAAATADLVVSELRSRLAVLVQEQRAKWQSNQSMAYTQVQRLQQQRINTEGQLKLKDEDMEEIMAKTGLADVSPEILRQLLATLQMQHETAQIDIAGKTARRDALAESVASLSKQLQDKVQADVIAQQWQQVVEARQKELENKTKLREVGQASQSDVDNAMANVATAKVQLAERQSEIAKGTGDTLQEWNQELLTLSVDLAELNARSVAMEKRLKALSDTLHMMEDQPTVESLVGKLNSLNDAFESVERQMIGNGLDAKRPELVVVESRNEAWKH